MQYFPGSHTGAGIKVKLDKMIEELGLATPDLLKFAVNDNAANAKLAIKLSDYLIQVQ